MDKVTNENIVACNLISVHDAQKSVFITFLPILIDYNTNRGKPNCLKNMLGKIF